MIQETIEKYARAFASLRRGNQNAPHKPLLILAILEQIQSGAITSNRIYITSELLLSFKELSAKLAPDYPNEIYFAMPFFHMKGEPFWHLKPNMGFERTYAKIKSIKSISKLRLLIEYAEIDFDCFNMAINPLYNEILVITLLNNYFPNHSRVENEKRLYDYEQNIEYQILHESKEEYQKIIIELGKAMDDNQFEEEQFIRSGKFKRIIPMIYNNTCAISGHKLESTVNIQMIDACHIIPFGESYNDTITNGIALSPSIHRAFDRMLITINSNYIIRVSPTVIESESPFSLKQFNGKQIILPEQTEYHPSIESLAWHNSRFIL